MLMLVGAPVVVMDGDGDGLVGVMPTKAVPEDAFAFIFQSFDDARVDATDERIKRHAMTMLPW